MLVSALSFTSMSAFVRRQVHLLPDVELVFFRSLINLLWVSAILVVLRESPWPKNGKRILLFRGVVGFLGVICMFYSIGKLAFPVAAMLNWSSPLFVILFSRLILGERMPPYSGVFIPLAFAGLVLLLDPMGATGTVPFFPAAVGLLAAVFGGMAYVAVRAASARAGVYVIVFYFTAVSTIASAPLAARVFVAPTDATQWLEILCLGTFATVAQLTMTRAYRFAAAGTVSMMNLLNPVLGAAVGLLLFQERLAGFQWIGMVFVGAALVGLTTQGAKRAVR